MGEAMQTLNTFFNTHAESMNWVTEVINSQEFAPAQQLIAKDAGIQIPASFYEKLIGRLCDALDIEIGDILVWGWRKQREIAAYRNKENPPGVFYEVPLVEHTLTSKHSPGLKPVIDGITLPKVNLKFDIIMKLKIDGVILFIRDGKIMRASAGTCTGKGSIEYSGVTILEKKTGPFTLPGSLSFRQGIPI